MSKTALSLFPARVAIGTLQPDGSVLPSPEFVRSMSALFTRVGGAIGMGVDDLALLASTVSQPDQQARRAAADAAVAPAIDHGPLLAALLGKISALQAQVSQVESVHAEVAKLRKRLAGMELQAGHRDPYRVNWERPGRIGFFTPNTGAFTTVNKLILTPPTTGATFTLANGKTFTVSNTVTLTATDGATLAIGGGGTLGSAAYQPTSAFAARTNTALAPVATDAASTQALANSLRSALLSVGIGS